MFFDVRILFAFNIFPISVKIPKFWHIGSKMAFIFAIISDIAANTFIVIIFVLMLILHSCMGWTVSCKRRPSIYLFIEVLVDFIFFQMTSDYLFPCFLWLPSRGTNTNFESSTYDRPLSLSFILPRCPNHWSLLSCNRPILCTHVEFNMLFATKGKPILSNKGTKFLNLHHSPLILFYNTAKCTLSSSYCVTKIK